jgi:hypothetical protein
MGTIRDGIPPGAQITKCSLDPSHEIGQILTGLDMTKIDYPLKKSTFLGLIQLTVAI